MFELFVIIDILFLINYIIVSLLIVLKENEIKRNEMKFKRIKRASLTK